MVGTATGIYRIIAKLGAGGMGEVFRARDTKLDQDVAFKILPEVLIEPMEQPLSIEHNEGIGTRPGRLNAK